jgi:DNA-binding PadR family transcriptional regulator
MSQFELTEMGLLVLSQLTTKVHGYDIMKNLEETLSGAVTIGPATLYTTLSKLVTAGWCEYEHVGNKKVYGITKAGHLVLQKEYEKKERILHVIKERIDQQ